MAKVNQTISIETEVKREFKAACSLDGNDMSETIEEFMKNYVELSKSMRNGEG